MLLYRLTQAGSLDNLVKLEEAEPAIGPNDVLVRVHAVSLNARDLMMVYGPQPYGPKPDIIPASDGAGEVVACGAGVSHIQPGARVVICLDVDALDPAIMPAVIGRTAGGLSYWQVFELIAGVAVKARIVAFDMVEFMPERDIDGQGAAAPYA